MTDIEPGLRDHLLTRRLKHALARLDEELVHDEPLDAAEGPERLARHAMIELSQILADGGALPRRRRRESTPCSATSHAIPPRIRSWSYRRACCSGIKARSPLGQPVSLPTPPATPFSQSDLLVNAEGQPNIGSELKAELAAADSVDLICAFVIWSGVRQSARRARRGHRSRRACPGRHDDLHGRDREAGRRRARWRSAAKSASRSTRGPRSCTRRPGCSSASPV